MIQIKQVIGGRRNVALHITGMLTEGDLELTPIDLDSENRLEQGAKQRAKLSSLAWVVQEKLTLYLCWNKTVESLVMPLESRNSLRPEVNIAPPERWTGTMWITSTGYTEPVKCFFIALDFDI